MLRGFDYDIKALKNLSTVLEDSGYHSVLLTFHSQQADYFVKSAAALNPGDKLKYMIALRPYHVSPQYCSMMTNAYSQIDKNRLVFNWVAGDFHTRDDEPELEFDVFGESEIIDTIQKRTTYLRKFVNMYKLYCPTAIRPPMVFSGSSDYSLETARMFKSTSLCMLDTYRDNIEKFYGIESRMVSANVTILESDKDIEEYRQNVIAVNPRHINFSIVGDYQTVKQKIIELKNEKITDLLLFTDSPNLDLHGNQHNDMIVNKLVKEISSEARQNDN
jgi:alkanesulfonate monooxygenase SsuD/methylene tetrahydromethanopterin reductase-like flavin-dependent oxidoreductase (luciferase family)